MPPKEKARKVRHVDEAVAPMLAIGNAESVRDLSLLMVVRLIR